MIIILSYIRTIYLKIFEISNDIIDLLDINNKMSTYCTMEGSKAYSHHDLRINYEGNK